MKNWPSKVKQYTDTKEYYIDPTGEPIETTLRAEYEEAIKNLNLDSELYDVIPQSTNVTTLTAGVLKASKKEGITNYINAIRDNIIQLVNNNDNPIITYNELFKDYEFYNRANTAIGVENK